MIVVDTNILVYLYLPCEFTPQAEQLLLDEPQWATPILWQSEFRNVLAGILRRGQLTLVQAVQLQQEAETMMAGFEFDVSSESVLTLVERSDCSAYDCEFVTLAQHLGVKLITMDGKILRAFPETAVALTAR
ncbi:type II toxin-antitoxin system VapC family toxin [Trichloromonas sp.]|uniref:type II toxin-antitoxin system VapC family toxin n=1 Tax=Trichloromonas sp. TaxID=3069249 RepID=UPI002A4A9D7B|nr:type II toxin-antitoxin system VapC family toxin [Trichloromonas sp.]